MKFVKGKQVESGARVKAQKPMTQVDNPWISRRLFDLLQERTVKAENMCKDLIRVSKGEKFLARYDYDYLAAGTRIVGTTPALTISDGHTLTKPYEK
jgi:hypothetical protein